jgi:hypothetical protein
LGLVFAIIQFGVILAQQVALNGAVRSGARFGSVNAYSGSHTCGAVVQKVQDAAATIAMAGSAVSVQVFRSGEADPVCDSTDSSSLPGLAPCINGAADINNPDVLTVKAQFSSDFLVPLPIGRTSLDVASEGSYQCEYNK